MSKLPCNQDCFNCKFPDCIVDGTLSNAKTREKTQRKYYEKNKQKILEKTKQRRKEKKAQNEKSNNQKNDN